MFPHTIEGMKTAVDQVGRTIRQMTYFLSSHAMWRRCVFCPNKTLSGPKRCRNGRNARLGKACECGTFSMPLQGTAAGRKL